MYTSHISIEMCYISLNSPSTSEFLVNAMDAAELRQSVRRARRWAAPPPASPAPPSLTGSPRDSDDDEVGGVRYKLEWIRYICLAGSTHVPSLGVDSVRGQRRPQPAVGVVRVAGHGRQKREIHQVRLRQPQRGGRRHAASWSVYITHTHTHTLIYNSLSIYAATRGDSLNNLANTRLNGK